MSDARIKRAKQRLRFLIQDRGRRIRLLLEKGLIKDASEIPEDAIPIDAEKSTKAPAWIPGIYYADIAFHCSDCGKHEVWTAESQQYYFEVMQSPPYKGTKRCYDCRQKFNVKRDRDRGGVRETGVREEPPVG